MSATLTLMRHAKSAYPPNTPDIERPLNKRGQTDAIGAGDWLATHLPPPDAVVISVATRTQQTWELVRGRWPAFSGTVLVDPLVYEAECSTLVGCLNQLPEGRRSVLLLGHNPGLEELLCRLTGVPDIHDDQVGLEKFATSAIAVLDVSRPWPQLADETQATLRVVHIARGSGLSA